MYNASNVRALTCVRRKCAWGGHALLDACVSPTSFLSVRGFAPEGQHRSKSLLCAVRPFHAWLGASLPSHSSSVNESSGQDELPRRAMRDTPLVGRALSDSTCKMCALRCMLDRAGMGGSHFRFHSSPKTAEVCGTCDSCEERALSDSVSNMRAVRCALVSTTLERTGAPRLTFPFHIHFAMIGSRLAVRCTPLS